MISLDDLFPNYFLARSLKNSFLNCLRACSVYVPHVKALSLTQMRITLSKPKTPMFIIKRL